MYILANGRLITRDSALPYLEDGGVAIDGERIAAVGSTADLRAEYPEAEFVDAKGGVIMPGLVNAHTHIYSALARGLAIDGNSPTSFLEVLEGTWWAIDRRLTLAGTRASADALYMDCIKQGVTTIFDHHASYGLLPVLRGQRPGRGGEGGPGRPGEPGLPGLVREAPRLHAGGHVRRPRPVHHQRRHL